MATGDSPAVPSLPPSLMPRSVAAMADTDPTTDEAQTDPEVEVEEDATEVEVEAANLLSLDDILPLSKYQLPLGEWDQPPTERVRFAMDMLVIAACERRARILRSDLES